MVAAKKPASAGTGEVRRELKLALMARELAAWKLLAYAYDGSSMHLDAHNQRAFAEKCRALARRIRTEKIDILDVLEALNGLAESADDEESASYDAFERIQPAVRASFAELAHADGAVGALGGRRYPTITWNLSHSDPVVEALGTGAAAIDTCIDSDKEGFDLASIKPSSEAA